MILESAETERFRDSGQDAIMGCELCGRRVDWSHISEYTLCDDCYRVWEIAFPMGFQLGRERTLSELKEAKWI